MTVKAKEHFIHQRVVALLLPRKQNCNSKMIERHVQCAFLFVSNKFKMINTFPAVKFFPNLSRVWQHCKCNLQFFTITVSIDQV